MNDLAHIPSNLISVGWIARAFGVHGEFKVVPFSKNINRFHAIREIELILDGESLGRFQIEKIRLSNREIIMKISHIDTPEEVSDIRGAHLCVNENESIETNDWEFFHHELIGMSVYTETNRFLGKIQEIMETGANDVYVVRDDITNEYLIPATRQHIVSIDTDSNRMIIFDNVVV